MASNLRATKTTVFGVEATKQTGKAETSGPGGAGSADDALRSQARGGDEMSRFVWW